MAVGLAQRRLCSSNCCGLNSFSASTPRLSCLNPRGVATDRITQHSGRSIGIGRTGNWIWCTVMESFTTSNQISALPSSSVWRMAAPCTRFTPAPMDRVGLGQRCASVLREILVQHLSHSLAVASLDSQHRVLGARHTHRSGFRFVLSVYLLRRSDSYTGAISLAELECR
jgi:hypothetical protein